MQAQLKRFCVVGLHDRRTIDVHIEDNKLILVGENGTGKSTFANLIYFFLTRQWRRLHEYRFEVIEASLGDVFFSVTPSEMDAYFAARKESTAQRRYLTPWRRSFIRRIQDYSLQELEHDQSLIRTFAEEMDVSLSAVRELIDSYLDDVKKEPTKLQQTEEKLSSIIKSQLLYLPTYRRIEQELRSIFRGLDIESDIKKFRMRLSARREGAPFIELVEFGMEDVEQMITNRMSQIKESVRNGLGNLTGTYLREVIRGVHTKVDVVRVRDIDSKTLDAIFERIDEATLPAEDKGQLKEKVATISARREIHDQDKVIAHFLVKLVELYKDQQLSERDVRDFVALCNQYLTGKEMVYDNTKYTIFIRLEMQDGQSQEPLKMKLLSSGEKQIVSLFAHLYLSGEKSFNVVIDEPELSLSVPWQRRFLPDILKTELCHGLIAVTHSPFVWDNELEPYVRSLAEFTKPYHESH